MRPGPARVPDRRLLRRFAVAAALGGLAFAPGAAGAAATAGTATAGTTTGAATGAATAAEVRPSGTFSNWNWPSSGFYNMDQRLTVLGHSATGRYFWSHEFYFERGTTGYLGLQNRSAPNLTKIALFSIWDANAARGPRCGTFGGEGTGYTCRIDPYTWVTGRTYRLRVWAVGRDSGGQWWGAWVQDTVSGVDSYIGSIRVPGAWGNLTNFSVSWTENFGAKPATCAGLPWAKAQFTFPTANNGSVRLASHSHRIDPTGTCPAYSRILHVPGADVQEMGRTLPPAPALDLPSYPLLGQGTAGPAVKAAQYLLLVRGHDSGQVDGVWGPRSALGAESFQGSVGLTADGLVGQRTWTALLSGGTRPTLSRGTVGDDVRRLQRALTAALGRTVPIDGTFGADTETAVRDYQRSRGLGVDGIAGPLTWDALQHGR
jgi:peptidoglycan hydrolase-like protein with peptidoglycan-binding domain